MEKNKKRPSGKIGKVALCGAIAFGSLGSVIAYDNITGNNVSMVSAASEYVVLANNNGYSSTLDFPIKVYKIYIEFNDVAGDFFTISEYKTFDSVSAFINETYTYSSVVNGIPGEFGDFTGYFATNVTIGSVSNASYDSLNSAQKNCADKAGNVTLRKMINDTSAPALETQVFLTDVDSPMSLEYILSQVKFVDEVDGDLEEVIVNDNYTSNMNKVGKWTIEVKATDKAGNTGYGTIEVWVQDKTSPMITGKSTFTSNMSSPITRSYIESQLVVSDNVDEKVELTLVSDGFTGNENIVGVKTIVYRATDSAGNTSVDYTISVNCVDDVKPTITGDSSYTTSYKVNLDINTLKNGLVLNDNISTNLQLEEVSNNYIGNESIPGIYQIKYRTTDEAGNISEVFTITIEVNDKIPPVFYTNGLFIGVSQAQTLSHQDIVNILLYMQGLENSNMGVSLLSLDGYEVDGVNQPMAYSIRYQLVNEDGTNYGEELTATINVLGEEEVKENDEKTQVEQRVKNLWKKIGDFFENLWNWIVKYLGFGWLWDKEGKYNPNW